MIRSALIALTAFTLAGIVIAATLTHVLPSDWSPDAFAAAGIAAAALAGAVAGLAGGPGAVAGATAGALVLFLTRPQFDLTTLATLLAVTGAAALSALPRSRAGRRSRPG